jgi:hypothetical protein
MAEYMAPVMSSLDTLALTGQGLTIVTWQTNDAPKRHTYVHTTGASHCAGTRSCKWPWYKGTKQTYTDIHCQSGRIIFSSWESSPQMESHKSRDIGITTQPHSNPKFSKASDISRSSSWVAVKPSGLGKPPGSLPKSRVQSLAMGSMGATSPRHKGEFVLKHENENLRV